MNIADDEKDNNKSPASTSGSSSAQANSVKESSSSTFSQPTKTSEFSQVWLLMVLRTHSGSYCMLPSVFASVCW